MIDLDVEWLILSRYLEYMNNNEQISRNVSLLISIFFCKQSLYRPQIMSWNEHLNRGTVKPANNGHPRERQHMVFIDKWSLFGGYIV